jgi:RNA polymerase sigma factor (sigma-70 family)
MLLQINGIGDHKIAYKDHKDIEFDSLDKYLLLARKSISKFANSFFGGLAKKMLNDEDAVASVANAIMMADWRWDENYSNEQGTKKTKYSYRNQCALWAIQTYVTKMYKKPKKINKVYSLDYDATDNDNMSIHECLEDNKNLRPDELIADREQKENLSQLIEQIFEIDCLSERQKDYIRLYYFENYTFDKIGKKYGITREAVRQGLNKAILTIRSFISNE